MSSENDDNSEKAEKDGEKILNKIENEKEGIRSFSVINKYYLLPFICPSLYSCLLLTSSKI